MRARIRSGSPALALALAAVLVVSGCGSDNGDDAEDQQPTEETTAGEESDDTDEDETPDEDDADAPTPAPDDDLPDATGDATEDATGDEVSDDEAEVAEAIEHMQGVWQSEDSETRVLAVEDATVVLVDDGAECFGGHDEGPVPITLAVYCDDDPPRVANTMGDGETLTLDWVGESPEDYTWIAESTDQLN